MTAVRKKNRLFSSSVTPEVSDIQKFDIAVKRDNVPVIKAFLKIFSRHGKNPVDMRKAGDTTPLMMAVARNNHDAARCLIHYGADINAADMYQDNSPLITAVHESNYKMVDLLIEAGAGINTVPSALFAAMWGRNIEMLRYLMQKNPPLETRFTMSRTILHQTVSEYMDVYELKDEYLSILIKAGADLNAQDIKGMTPLMLAAKSCSTKAFRTLLEAGADASLTDKEGQTALAMAAEPLKKEFRQIFNQVFKASRSRTQRQVVESLHKGTQAGMVPHSRRLVLRRKPKT